MIIDYECQFFFPLQNILVKIYSFQSVPAVMILMPYFRWPGKVQMRMTFRKGSEKKLLYRQKPETKYVQMHLSL